MRAIADRKDECSLFEQLLAGKLGARIMLLEGTGERGKSTLLAEFARSARAKWGAKACAALELKQGVALRQVFHGIYQGFGSATCPQYFAIRGQHTTTPITVSADLSRAEFGDANQVQLNPTVTVYETEPLARLAEALLEDLSVLPGPALLILDTYNEATPECAKWLLEALLPVVAMNEKLFCIVGGRSVPKTSEYGLSWRDLVRVRTLETDISLDDWHEYACGLFPGFPLDRLETVYVGLRDRPGSIRTYIHNTGPIFCAPTPSGIAV